MGTLNGWFIFFCWVFAAYFGVAFATAVGFPPDNVTDRWPLLVMFLIFFIVPFAQKLEIFQFLTFERRLEYVQGQVKEAQDQIRHIQSLQATLTNSVVNNFYAGVVKEEQEEARDGLQSVSKAANEKSKDIIAKHVDRPHTESLVMLKANIERELRKLLQKQIEFQANRKPTKYISFRSLADRFVQEYPKYGELSASFSYFANIANAASHGQNIPEEIASEAVRIGTKLYAQISLMNDGDEDVEHVV